MGWRNSLRTRAAGFAVAVFGLSALVGCSGGSTEVTASEERVADAPAGDMAEQPSAVTSDASYYLAVFRGGAQADLAESERKTLASDALRTWRVQSDTGPQSREEMAKSFGVEPAELDAYLEQASRALSESGVKPPDLESLSPSKSSIYTETASVCGNPVAVTLFPVVDGKVVALNQYEEVAPLPDAKLADGVDQAWSTPFGAGGSIVILTTQEVPEVSVSVAVTDPTCDAASVLSEVSLERGSR